MEKENTNKNAEVAVQQEKHWCQNQDRCGGCFYQEIPYEEEVAKKEQEIRDLFDPVIQGDYLFEGIISSPRRRPIGIRWSFPSAIRKRMVLFAWDYTKKEAFSTF